MPPTPLNAVQLAALKHLAGGGMVGTPGLKGVPIGLAGNVMAFSARTIRKLDELGYLEIAGPGLFRLSSSGRLAVQSLRGDEQPTTPRRQQSAPQSKRRRGPGAKGAMPGQIASSPEPPPFLRFGGQLGEMIAAKDWAATSLGPVENWPSAVKSVLASWLDSPQAMFIAWGPELRFFFNEAYLPFLGARGGDGIGEPFPEVWPEIWEDVRPIAFRALAGHGVRQDRLHLVMQRNGYPEETWWNFTCMPLRDHLGTVIGMMCTVDEASPDAAQEDSALGDPASQ